MDAKDKEVIRQRLVRGLLDDMSLRLHQPDDVRKQIVFRKEGRIPITVVTATTDEEFNEKCEIVRTMIAEVRKEIHAKTANVSG